MGLAEEILALQDRASVEVEVPEWGGRKLRVMALSAADRDAYEVELYLERKAGGLARNVRARLVGRCVVDADGTRVFSDEQIAALGTKSAKALDRLFEAASGLNGLSEKDVEALEKK